MSEQATSSTANKPRFTRHLSPLGVWALSFGCSVGWGAFVMPGTTFLPIAGPLGTAVGIVVGALIMLIVGINYHYLMNRYPDSGGAFTYSKRVFGYDHGFLSSWFLGLVYLAIIWANATALPLIFRSLFGNLLQIGYLYTLAGYEVYVGEILLSLSVTALFMLLCLRGGRIASAVQIGMALLLAGGVLAAAGGVFLQADGAAFSELSPLFSPVHSPAAGSLFIVFLGPWAFAGFESISHSSEEFKFSPKKALPIMCVSLSAAAAAYILLALIAATARPEGYADWTAYVRDLGNLGGVDGNPVFYSVRAALGTPGLIAIGLAAAAGIITGLVGNTVAASRMIFSMARDDLLPVSMSKLNRHGVPENAILFLLLICVPIPFLGRAAIGWIVDINTIGVTVAYAYTSAAAFREALRERKPLVRVTGLLGMVISVFFLLYFLIPNLWSVSRFANESYLMLLFWMLAGFVVFYLLFRRDRSRRMGRSTAVWIILILLIFFTSIIWVLGITEKATAESVSRLNETYTEAFAQQGVALTDAEVQTYSDELTGLFDRVTGTVIRSTVVQFIIVLLAVLIIFRIYSTVHRRHQIAVEDKTIAEQSNQAKTTFLSNMSHDIRTPMNAIIGYVTLAKRDKDLSPGVRDYLSKIETSSGHLLSLINDVLELSRIESGKMELAPIPTDVPKMMSDVRDLFSTQMETKGLVYTVTCENITDGRVLCDRNRFDRVLLNLISNAYKFTPEGGSVAVTMTQTGREGSAVFYRLRVRDTGIGMSPEFAAKVFEAYERERTSTVENIQGTGLGTAITKGIVDLMGGTIEVFSEQGKGSEFVVHVSFPVDPEADADAKAAGSEKAAASVFAGMRLLLAEDDPDNRDVARTLLEEAGFTVETVENGEDAVERIAASAPGDYAAVLMDIEMPVKNGYDATRLIRSLKNPALAGIPIVALTARAFSEDIAAAREMGMNAHIAKPIDMKTVMETMSKVLL